MNAAISKEFIEYNHSAAYIARMNPEKFSSVFYKKSIIVVVPMTDIPTTTRNFNGSTWFCLERWEDGFRGKGSFGCYHFNNTDWSVVVYSNINDVSCKMTSVSLNIKDMCNGWDSDAVDFVNLENTVRSFKAYTYKRSQGTRVFIFNGNITAQAVRIMFKNIRDKYVIGTQGISDRLFQTFNGAKTVANPTKNYITLGMEGGFRTYDYKTVPTSAMRVGGLNTYAKWVTADGHTHVFGCYSLNLNGCGAGHLFRFGFDATAYEKKEYDNYWLSDTRKWAKVNDKYYDTIQGRSVYSFKLNKDDLALLAFLELEMNRLNDEFTVEWKEMWKFFTGIDL